VRRLPLALPSTIGKVLTLVDAGQDMREVKVSAAQLAALVHGAKTPKLVEPLASGMWLAVDTDRVMSFAQQFQP
jgi:hypothetical protein